MIAAAFIMPSTVALKSSATVAGGVAGRRGAGERAGGAELFGRAEAAGGDRLRRLDVRLLNRHAAGRGAHLGHEALAVGVDALGEEVVDRDIVGGDLFRES